jgi:4-hydroxy-4-methyl-2-oxoglutarate aldolase
VTITINPNAPDLPVGLVKEASSVDVPTLGHFLEEGFCDPAIARQTGSGRLVGRAVTVRITATDSTLVHKVTALLQPGDVLVVDTGGDRIHAPVGGVVASAIAASGALGVIIDGVCTDLAMLADTGLSVYSRGTSVLTTKLHGIDAGGINVPVTCGGVPVQPGALVLGDDNGVLIANPAHVAAALGNARESDDSEPALLEKLRAGQKLPQLSAADRLLAELGYEV